MCDQNTNIEYTDEELRRFAKEREKRFEQRKKEDYKLLLTEYASLYEALKDSIGELLVVIGYMSAKDIVNDLIEEEEQNAKKERFMRWQKSVRSM